MWGLKRTLPFSTSRWRKRGSVYASTGPRRFTLVHGRRSVPVMCICRCRIPPHRPPRGVYHHPEVSSSRATVAVQVEVDGWQKHDVRIRTTLRNPKGVLVGSVQSVGMPEHTHQTCTEVRLPALTLENPQLWSCGSPQLYNAEVVVMANGMVVDSLNEQFGIRRSGILTGIRLQLNGKKYSTGEMPNHHDLGAVGAASYDRGHRTHDATTQILRLQLHPLFT